MISQQPTTGEPVVEGEPEPVVVVVEKEEEQQDGGESTEAAGGAPRVQSPLVPPDALPDEFGVQWKLDGDEQTRREEADRAERRRVYYTTVCLSTHNTAWNVALYDLPWHYWFESSLVYKLPALFVFLARS